MSYCERADIEAIFGRENVAKWADLDNRNSDADIAARIAVAITRGTEQVDKVLRTSRYALPLANSDDDTPGEIVDLAATWAGVWLYESRGTQEFNEVTGAPIHRLTWHRSRVLRELGAIRDGAMTIDAVLGVAQAIPAVVEDEDDDHDDDSST